MKDLGFNHDTNSASSNEGPDPRSVRGSDRQSASSQRDEEGAWPVSADQGVVDRTVEAELEGGSERSDTVEAIARSESFRGPLPPVVMIEGYERVVPGSGYERVVPGSAAKIVDAHIANERARAGALTRLTRAESIGVVVGTFGAQLLSLGGLAAGVSLILNGFPTESLWGFIPASVSATALVVSAVRGNKVD